MVVQLDLGVLRCMQTEANDSAEVKTTQPESAKCTNMHSLMIEDDLKIRTRVWIHGYIEVHVGIAQRSPGNGVTADPNAMNRSILHRKGTCRRNAETRLS